MAASASNPSPSNHPVGGGASARLPSANVPVENSGKDVDSNADLKVTDAVPEPTYEDSEKSDYYKVAMAFLKNGDFEQALEMCEGGIEATREKLSGVEDVTLHEAMAPFNYLYGTTLLYSIEESTSEQSMTVATTAAVGEDNGDQSPDADDSEIAWECLETARTILEQLLMTSTDETRKDKLRVDLAQVYLREGDLGRLNGRYEAAIHDYSSCLELREATKLLDPYDRKIADVHYNLSVVYMLQVGEAKSQDEKGPASAEKEIEKKAAALRSRGFHHSLMCGRALCGQVALLCNVDPHELITKAESDIPNLKSTGEDDDCIEHPKVASMKLHSLRRLLDALQAPSDPDLCEEVENLRGLLTEIQETVDEAKNSEKGLQQVTEMKAEISAAVAAGTDQANSEQEANASVAFGSTEAAATSAVAKPIMAVKKKKRTGDEAKMAPDDRAAKRSSAGDV